MNCTAARQAWWAPGFALQAPTQRRCSTNDGELHPAYVGGKTDITGSYAQSSDAKLVIEFAGADFDSRDFLAIAGAATLDGILDIDLVGSFRPSPSSVFTILSASSITG